jgi:uncharacterized membrane protein
MLGSVLIKLLWLPALWFFFWAIYPLAWVANGEPIYYIMLSLSNWLCMILSIFAAVVLKALLLDSKMRPKLRVLKLKREEKQEKPKQEAVNPAKKQEESLRLFHTITAIDNIGVLSLIWTITGSFSLLYYLRTVENGASHYLLHWGFISLSIGILLSFFYLGKEDNLSISNRKVVLGLLIIFTANLTMNLANSVRFDVLTGADVLWEYRAARNVLEDGWWNWSLSNSYRYHSALSISVFPTIISQVCGLDLLDVFGYVLPVICSLVPIFIFLLIYQTFNNSKLAFLSAIVYLESYFTIPSFGREIKRQPIAIIFMLCSLIILLKVMEQKDVSAKERRKYIAPLALFSFGLVVSHYTISFLLLAILLAICIALATFYAFQSWFKKILKVEVPSAFQIKICVVYLLLFAIMCIGWNILIAPRYTMQYVDYFRSMLTGGFKTIPTQLETEVVFEVLGPVVTAWLFLVMGSSVIGFLILTRTQKTLAESVFLVSGGLLLLMYPAWFIRAHEASWYMSLTRFIGISFIFLCVFVAYVLLKQDKKFRHIFTVLFILLNLPMNMLLPIYTDYVLYSPEKTVPIEMAIRQLHNKQQDLAAAVWTCNFVASSEIISSDTPGVHALFYSNNILAEVLNASYGNGKTGNIMAFRPFVYFTSEKLHEIQSKYLFLDVFAVQYGLWYVAGPARDFRITQVNMTDLLSFSNKIYDNGESFLLIKR